MERDDRVRVIQHPHEFNYSAITNAAVKHAKGEYLALVNNDTEVISENWLNEMMGLAARPNTGCVGAKLYYPNDTIQHAGVIVGLGGVAGHSHKYFPRESPGYFCRLILAQNFTAVTAACLVVKKSIFQEVGGFDEKKLKIAFNDVDFCLKVNEYGYNNVWTPWAELYHHESKSRGVEDTPDKVDRFNSEVSVLKLRWQKLLKADPAYNPNLTKDQENFSLTS
jgi:GT2 family glycosyltransferase